VAPVQIWQDPVPAVDHGLITERDIAKLKREILRTDLTVPQLVKAAWASASTYRDSDKRGGANGARVMLEPQKSWEVNAPGELAIVLDRLGSVRSQFNASAGGDRSVSMADMIVIGGCAAVESAAKRAGHNITVPFIPGRTDATPEMTDEASFAFLRPMTDGFRNYVGREHYRRPEVELVDRANQLTLTAPEMTVLLGGMRALGANYDDSARGVFTGRAGALTNDFFVNLLDTGTEWKKSASESGLYEGYDRETGELKWTASSVDLTFGANSQLRAIAEVYASDDAERKFVDDFVAAWNEVMNLDRFDIRTASRVSDARALGGE
jgi:catalase-peroxidase